MRHNNDGMSRVLTKLNESQAALTGVEAEPTVGVDQPTNVKQCESCSGFYTGTPAVCPICGAPLPLEAAPAPVNEKKSVRSRKRRLHEDTTVVVNSGDPDDADAVVAEPEVLPSDVEVELNEAMKLLSKGDCKKFNENYSSARIMKNGKLNLLLESESGRVYSVVRKMNAVQRANFKLSESLKSKKSARVTTAAKLESTRNARMNLVALSEMKSIKVAALRLLERQGVKYDFNKFNSALNESIMAAHGNLKKKFEGIIDDKQTGLVDFTESTPEEISADVTEIIEDTGLAVVTQAVEEITPETTEVLVRVQDDPSIEVNLQDVAETISEVTETPVAVVGPTPAEGDAALADVVVILNPDDETIDEIEEEETVTPIALSESLRARRSRRLNENQCGTTCDDPNADPDLNENDDDDEDCNDDLPKLSERQSRRRGLRRISESEDPDNNPEDDPEDGNPGIVENEGDPNPDDNDDDEKIVIVEQEGDSDETLELIDQARELNEKIAASRK